MLGLMCVEGMVEATEVKNDKELDFEPKKVMLIYVMGGCGSQEFLQSPPPLTGRSVGTRTKR